MCILPTYSPEKVNRYIISQSFATHRESLRMVEPGDVMKTAAHTLRNERTYRTGTGALQKRVKTDVANLTFSENTAGPHPFPNIL